MDVLTILLLLIFAPIIVILGGVALEAILKGLDKLATTPLLFGVVREGLKTLLRTLISIYVYYLVVSTIIVFMVKNLLISQFAQIPLEDWQVYVLGLSLSFLPRVVRLATGVVEKARFMLLSILTPLSLMAFPMLVLQPESIRLPTEDVHLLILGSLYFAIFCDFVSFVSVRYELLRPRLDIETAGITNLRRAVESERVFDFPNLCRICSLAKRRGRIGLVRKTVDALVYAVELAIERRNKDVLTRILNGLQELESFEEMAKVLGTFASSSILILDEKLKVTTEKVFKQHLETYQLTLSDTKQLRRLIGRYSHIRCAVRTELVTQARTNPSVIQIIKSLYQDTDLYIRRFAIEALLELSRTVPEVFDADIIHFIGETKEEHAKILAKMLLEHLEKAMPEGLRTRIKIEE